MRARVDHIVISMDKFKLKQEITLILLKSSSNRNYIFIVDPVR
jgi:hypothetical protein